MQYLQNPRIVSIKPNPDGWGVYDFLRWIRYKLKWPKVTLFIKMHVFLKTFMELLFATALFSRINTYFPLDSYGLFLTAEKNKHISFIHTMLFIHIIILCSYCHTNVQYMVRLVN